MDYIRIRGARQHNLQNLDIDLPKGKFIVVTGPSGSGKSSLAFHTLYAEGQRRYVESLSAYARQYLDQLEKPEVDSISGLSPSVAIEQGGQSLNPRSTLATSTEIYDYLRLLYAAAGVPYEPVSGRRLVRMSSGEIASTILLLGENSKLYLLAPLNRELATEPQQLAKELQKQGFIRVRIDGRMSELDELPEHWLGLAPSSVEVVVDRLVLRKGIESRLADSIEVALRICEWEMVVLCERIDGTVSEYRYPTRYLDAETGYLVADLSPKHFSFNSALGACSNCHGLGTQRQGVKSQFIPDFGLSLQQGAIRTWLDKIPQQRYDKNEEIKHLARLYDVNESLPLSQAPKCFLEALFFGESLKMPNWLGLCREAEMQYRSTNHEVTKRRLSKFLVEKCCESCKGARLKPEILSIRLDAESGNNLGIHEFCEQTVVDAIKYLKILVLPKDRKEVVSKIIEELIKRLMFLESVGLGYLELTRVSSSLSGGEGHRIRLATQLGAGLSGVLYVLDEPSIGLHPKDNARLINALKQLRDIGNTVLVVEHDAAMIGAADWVIELGPGAGVFGGELIFEGKPESLLQSEKSLTGRWLAGKEKMPRGQHKKLIRGSANAIKILGANTNHLKNIDVEIPLGGLVCVTGPSGSGKSTLVNDLLYRELSNRLNHRRQESGQLKGLLGIELIKRLVLVDQTPLGKSPRSNAATYTGCYDLIRTLYAKLPLSKQRGYGAGRFSFNLKGGRCEKCQGAGSLKIDMHFMADAYVVCDACQGQRFNRETLEVAYRGKNIHEVLALRIVEALDFFAKIPQIHSILKSLNDLGLGYLQLGQPANMLSGGEAQRVKLARELSLASGLHTLYLLDEPSTGLHMEELRLLMEALFQLRDTGHSLLVIEHHPEIIRLADWVIELGPGAGIDGGTLIFEGTPEAMRKSTDSIMGPYL